MRLSLALPYVLICLLSEVSRADDLKAIKVKIETEEAKLTQLRRERGVLGADLETVKKELVKLEKSKSEFREELGRAEKEIKVLELSRGEAEKDLAEEVISLEASLVELYKIQRRRRGVVMLFNASSSVDLLKRGHELSTVASYGDDVIERLSHLREQLRGEQLKFEELLNRRKETLLDLRKTTEELQERKKKATALLQDSQKKERQQREILQGLEEQARQIEKAIASVTGDTTPSESEAGEKESEQPQGYAGAGLDGFRGKLLFPVSGKLIQTFGKAQHEEFSDLIVVKGLEVSAPVSAKVTPVAPGKVVLAQVIPGFGNVVILDHGARFYTLYGRLATTLTQVGKEVDPKDVIGMTGEPDFRGRNFYFELRVKGKAVDPKSYFSKLPG